MVRTTWFVPFRLVGREIRIELQRSLEESRLAPLTRSSSTPAIVTLPEQRVEDERLVQQRKAELLLQSVRHGAVRR